MQNKAPDFTLGGSADEVFVTEMALDVSVWATAYKEIMKTSTTAIIGPFA